MKRIATVVVMAAVSGVIVSPAGADVYIEYNLSRAVLQYTADSEVNATSGRLLVSPTFLSTFDISLMAETDGGWVFDMARISSPGAFNFLMDLDLVRAGADVWTATGGVAFSDSNQSSNAIEADFTATRIALIRGAGDHLIIEGVLSTPVGAEGIPVNRGEPWTFAGAGNLGFAGSDGVDNQITVRDGAIHDLGDTVVLKFNVGHSSLDSLFGQSGEFEGGQVNGTIQPAPAAVVLGLLGLGLIGWRMRRYA